MFIATASIIISKPITIVFDFMLNASNYPKWITMLKSIHVKEDFKVGIKFEEITFFWGKEKYSKGVIKEIVPNKLIKTEIIEVVSGPKLFPVRCLELSEENGATEILWTTIVRTKGMMRLFEFMLPKQFEKGMNEFLQNLKHILENV